MRKEQSNSARQRMKIGELARICGLGIETLRYYERLGLLDCSSRSASGYRLFEPDAIERLEFIRKAQALGFTLLEIRELIEHRRRGENPCQRVRETVRARLNEINQRILQLQAYRDELANTLKDWEKQGDLPGHVCGLIESAEIEKSIAVRNGPSRSRPRSAQITENRKTKGEI
jgi:DNA-binding transcriptional MerR regulator